MLVIKVLFCDSSIFLKASRLVSRLGMNNEATFCYERFVSRMDFSIGSC